MAFYQTQVGKTLPVLWEHENKNGFMFGFTENYVRVQKAFDQNSVNKIEAVLGFYVLIFFKKRICIGKRVFRNGKNKKKS